MARMFDVNDPNVLFLLDQQDASGGGVPAQYRSITANPVDLGVPEDIQVSSPVVVPFKAPVVTPLPVPPSARKKMAETEGKAVRALTDLEKLQNEQASSHSSDVLVAALERMSNTFANRPNDGQMARSAENHTRSLAENYDKRQSSKMREVEAKLREQEMGLRVEDQALRKDEQALRSQALKQKLQADEADAKRRAQLLDPNSPQSKNVQKMVSGSKYLSTVFTPEEIGMLSAADAELLFEREDKNLSAAERAADRSQRWASLKEQIAARKEIAQMQRDAQAEAKKAAAEAKAEAAKQKDANAMAELSVGGLQIAPGARPTKKSAETMSTNMEKYNNINGNLDALEMLFNQAGTEQLPTQSKALMDGLVNAIGMDLKEMQNLGVLNGQDWVLLKQQMPDVTGFGVPRTNETIRKQFESFRRQLADKVSNSAKARGYVWEGPAAKTQPAPEAPKRPAKSYRYSPDGKKRVPVYEDGSFGPEEMVQ